MEDVNIQELYEQVLVIDNRTRGIVENLAKLFTRVQALEEEVKKLKGE